MRSYDKQPQKQSRKLDANPRASRQASLKDILQKYNQQPIQRKVINPASTDYISEEEFISQIGGDYDAARLREVFDSDKNVMYHEAMDYVTNDSETYNDFPDFVPLSSYHKAEAESAVPVSAAASSTDTGRVVRFVNKRLKSFCESDPHIMQTIEGLRTGNNRPTPHTGGFHHHIRNNNAIEFLFNDEELLILGYGVKKDNVTTRDTGGYDFHSKP